jgi:four helix bundle protein
VQDFKDLIAWQKGMELCRVVYRVTRDFPAGEAFGLTGQMRRAAVSIPSNIAEGRGRDSRKSYRHFLYLARGSACELETQVMLATDLEYLSRQEADVVLAQIGEVQRILSGLIRSLGDTPARVTSEPQLR